MQLVENFAIEWGATGRAFSAIEEIRYKDPASMSPKGTRAFSSEAAPTITRLNAPPQWRSHVAEFALQTAVSSHVSDH